MVWLLSLAVTGAAPFGASPVVRCAWGDAVACGTNEGRSTPMGLEGLTDACEAGDGAACGQAAFALRRGQAGEPDLPGAFRLYAEGCRAGHAPSCCEQAAAHRWGRGTPLDPDASFSRYQQACDVGEPCGCVGVAVRELEGRGTPADPDQGLARLGELCDREYPPACFELGRALVHREEPERALATHARACALGSERGCRQQTRLDDQLDETDKLARFEASCAAGFPGGCLSAAAVHADAERRADAHRSRERACDLGLPAGCRWVGIDLGKGFGVPEDDVAAVATYERAAAMGDVKAMRFLGRRAKDGDGMPADQSASIGWYRQACALEDVMSCNKLAGLHAEGVLQPATAEAAVAHLWPVCEAGSHLACARIARWLTPINGKRFFGDPATRDPRITELAERSCQGGESLGCVALAIRSHVGLDGTVDEARAAWAAEKACDADDAVGCARLAWHLDHGAGIPVDRSRARELWRRACDADYSLACVQLELRPLLQWFVAP